MSVHTLTPQADTDKQRLFQRLAVLRRSLTKAGDGKNAGKIEDLARKIRDSQFVFGFCGHFSAGKSAMINRMAGVDLLPSGPIPTTANLAKIRYGTSACARVYFQNSEPIEYPYPYDFDEIQRHAVDGKVHAIEIIHPLEAFGPGITILDTPGIDSTDEAHRASTESALHLADVIFYVTDYNHVQSEMNLAFLKKLNNENKRIVLVVNQIDKHSPAELDFKDYMRGIADTFSAQHIHLENIFYTSLKEADHPENQFPELRKYIHGFIENKDALLAENAESTARGLIHKHMNWRANQQTDEREQLEQSLRGLTEAERQNLMNRFGELQRQLDECRERPGHFTDTVQAKMNQTLDTAILMPYETREAARSYIESVQSDFKPGLFSSKKKAKLEREKRLDTFHGKITETSAVLDRQLKELLIQEAERFGIEDESFKTSVYDLKTDLNREMFAEPIQTGTLNANFVRSYCDKATAEIKRRYRHAMLQKLQQAEKILQQDTAGMIENIQTTMADMEEKITALNKRKQLDSENERVRETLDAALAGEIHDELEEALADFPEPYVRPVIKKATPKQNNAPQTEEKPACNRPEPVKEDGLRQSDDFQQRLLETAKQLRTASREIAEISGLQTAAREMQARASRLEGNRFTIALFGAFSAGKSSFANALIGENILPVSPNPTTAAVNKISPASEQHPHETACVRFKEEHQMLADVQQAVKSFGERLNDLRDLPRLLEKLVKSARSYTGNANLLFLEAVVEGLKEAEARWGKEQTVDMDAFYDIVANETKACFVESVELYYDCPLTRQGITLVDTPGADSVNSRHTGVAFDYIKNADAVLFVTYYNHAFSRADREFLIQLGRVKDSFAMDKMFFIVNAADLAASDSELNRVVDYVGENLASYGIQHPRIYPVSSKMALAAHRLTGDQMNDAERQKGLQRLGTADRQPISNANATLAASGMDRFKNDFIRFTMGELTNIAVEAAHGDIKRCLRTLDSFIASAKEDENVRRDKHRAALQTQNEIETFILSISPVSEKRAFEQEVDQLVYYVNERVFLRYMDLFKETFNPAVLGDMEQDKKQVLRNCLDELLQITGFDIAQEMRATALRIEALIARSFEEIFTKTSDKVERLAGHAVFSGYEKPVFETPDFGNALEDLDRSHFKDILGLFKNTKQFFAKNGQAAMRDRLQDRLRKPVAEYLKANGERLKTVYGEMFDQQTEGLKKRLLQETKEYTEGKIAVLSMDTDAARLESVKNTIEQILNDTT